MNQPHIPVRPIPLISFPSRRDLLRGLTSVGLALPIVRQPDSSAKKKRKRKNKKKVRRNDFGCVNVGGFCKNSGQCCSGICQGKKGKKKCNGHDIGDCQSGEDGCAGGAHPCTTSGGILGQCTRTTGNATYCEAQGGCFACTRDPDCQPFCGPQAACIVCEVACGPGGTACVGTGPDVCVF